MPELENIQILGAGWAGLAVAYWIKRQRPEVQVQVLEKSPQVMEWCHRKGPDPVPVGNLNPVPIEEGVEFPPAVWHLLDQWSGQSNLDWLRSVGLPVEPDSTGTIWLAQPRLFVEACRQALDSLGVVIHHGFTLESLSRQPDGSYLLWSREGERAEAGRLVLATGGERNHPLKLAGELGLPVVPPLAAFLRLRLASPKMGSQMGPLTREISLRCLKSGLRSTGWMALSSRGIEGQAVSRLSSRLGADWQQLQYRLQVEVDWLPRSTGSSVLAELVSRAERSGKRCVGDVPLFGFSGRAWLVLLQRARVDAGIPMARVKMKKLQALANRLKADPLSISGAGLPAGERAWTGGVALEGLKSGSLESRASPGLFLAGEILDLPACPDGVHAQLSWSSAFVAGSAAALGD